MQIARIVPKVRTQKEAIFDYAIPPELLPQIKPGLLVEIPFHGRKMEGVVIDLKRSSPIPHLKSLISIIDPIPVIDESHIKLAEWMSEYYISALGKTLFENIVPPAKRIIQRLSQDKNYTTLSARAYNKGYFPGKKYLIIADFKNRLNFYLKAIEKTLSRHQSSIIIVPDLSIVPYFTKQLTSPVSILHSGLTRTQRWLEFDKIRDGKIKLIIGSTSALFSPARNLGLIIIDQEESETYKNERSPRFHAVKVAEKLSSLSGANLILGSTTPRIETYNDSLKGKYKILKQDPSRSNKLLRSKLRSIPAGKFVLNRFSSKCLKAKQASRYACLKATSENKISIIDMNFEKQSISVPLQNRIDEMIKNKKKTLLILNRKGEGTKFSCPDCGWISLCEKCGLPLVPQRSENVCFRCQKQYQFPEKCPKCQNVHLKPMGLGTTRLKKFASDFWPKAKIIQIEKNLDRVNLRQNWDITIATSYALKFRFPSIGLVGIIDADQSLNFPDFHSAEKTFQNLYKFLKIGEQGIIQTHLPENYVISDLAKLDYDKFFLDEIENRQKANFPPFVQLIRLLYKNENESVCKEESQKVFSQLSQLIASNQLLIAILGPSPAFIKKERNKFRYQIIIKLKKRSKTLDEFLRSLPKDWIVDIDPVNLL